MNYDQMNEDQRRNESLFAESLSRHGWRARDTAEAIRSGLSVTPEGHALYENDASRLAAELFLEPDTLHLLIRSKQDGREARLRFKLGWHLPAVVDWLVARQNDLSVENFGSGLQPLIDTCEWVSYVDEAGNHFRLGSKR